MTQQLFERYYFSRPGYTGGDRPFHSLCEAHIRRGSEVLEIGSGPSNEFTEVLARIGKVTGVDIDSAVLKNEFCTDAKVFDGLHLPFPDSSVDACVSNWVLEHVENPEAHFKEVARVLRPHGIYCFRTTNLYHYVGLGARITPHGIHLALANRLRTLGPEAHDPYPTYHRANSRKRIRHLIHQSGLRINKLELIEPEPSYGRLHAGLFYPMMVYERMVNSTPLLSNFRIMMIGACTKDAMS